MAFHVTQCPGCESTFNTSARILQTAGGKVRCGACLMVFEATENFIDEPDRDESEDTSVFVGNDPTDYIDPSRFITRSALTDTEAYTEAFSLPAHTTADSTVDESLPSAAAANDSTLSDTDLDAETGIDPAISNLSISQAEADDDSDSRGFFTAVASELNTGDVEAEIIVAESTQTDSVEAETAEAGIAEHGVAEQGVAEQASIESELPLESAATSDVFTPAHAPLAPQTPARAPEDIRIHASFSMFHRQPAPREQAHRHPANLAVTDNSHTLESSQQDAAAAAATADEITATAPPVVSETIKNAADIESYRDGIHDSNTPASPDFVHAAPEPTAVTSNAVQAEIEVIDLDEFDDMLEPDADAVLTQPAVDSATPVVEEFAPAIDQSVATLDAEPDAAASNEAKAATAGEIATEEAVTAAESALDSDTTEAIRARALRALLRDDDALEALPPGARSAIGKDLPAVELLAGKQRHWSKHVLLTLTCILLGLTLAAQILWQRMPVYSRMAQLRPVYEFACSIASCELPTYSEISAIRSDNLVVRSHPSVEAALTVSLSFRNTAAFPQPFPILILSFNSASNSIIALREFAPGEYLDAGLQNISLMPVMSPVQIDLDVMDPGADAVNYTVAFRRP